MEPCRLLFTILVFNAIFALDASTLSKTNNGDNPPEQSTVKKESALDDMTRNALMSSLPILRFFNSNKDFKVNFREPNLATIKPTIHIINNMGKKIESNQNTMYEKKEFSNVFDSILSSHSGEDTKFGEKINKSKRIYPDFKNTNGNGSSDSKNGLYNDTNGSSIIKNNNGINFNNTAQHTRVHEEGFKHGNNGSPHVNIESESGLLHAAGHDSVVSQGQEESKNKHDSQQTTLTLNVTAIRDYNNDRHVNNNGKGFVSKFGESQSTTDLPYQSSNSLSGRKATYDEKRSLNFNEGKTKSTNSNEQSSEKSKNGDISLQREINTLDVYSKISEIQNILGISQVNKSAESSLEDIRSHKISTSTESRSNESGYRRPYDIEIKIMNKTRHVEPVETTTYAARNTYQNNQNNYKQIQDTTRFRSRGTITGRSSTEPTLRYNKDLLEQNYPRETIEKLLHYNLSNGSDIHEPTLMHNTEKNLLPSSTTDANTEYTNLQWIRVRTTPPPLSRDRSNKNFKNTPEPVRIRQIENNNTSKATADSEIITVTKYEGNNNINGKSVLPTVPNSSINVNNRQFLRKNHTSTEKLKKDGSYVNTRSESLDSGEKKELGVILVKEIINNSDNDEVTLDTEESSYYGKGNSDDGETKNNVEPLKNHQVTLPFGVNSFSSNKSFEQKKSKVSNDESTLDIISDEQERGSRKYSPTKFETIYPYSTDSMTKRKYEVLQTATSSNGLYSKFNNENELSDTNKIKNVGKPLNAYRGSIKYKYDPKSYDWTDDYSYDSGESSNFPSEFGYAYKAENDTDVYQKGFLKKIKNKKVLVVHGSYKYTAPDGTPILVSYTADENGFHPHETTVFDSKVHKMVQDLKKDEEPMDYYVETITVTEVPQSFAEENVNNNYNEDDSLII